MPELTLSGYVYEDDDLGRFAEPSPGPLTAQMADVTHDVQAHMVFGLRERASEGLHDTTVWPRPTEPSSPCSGHFPPPTRS